MRRMQKALTNVVLSCFVCVTIQLLSLQTAEAQSSTQSSPSHSIHLILNQDKFARGETIFIKAYFRDTAMKGVEGKHLISVFLIDQNGITRQTIRFNMLSGIGYNQMILPDSLSAGIYNVLAYVSPVEERSQGYASSHAITIVATKKVTAADPQFVRRYDSSAVTHSVISLKADRKIFDRKQKVKIDVATQSPDGSPVAAEFSVTVFNKNLDVKRADFSVPDGSIVGEGSSYFKVTELLGYAVDKEVMAGLSQVSVFQKNGTVIEVETGQAVPDNTQVLFYLQNAEWYHQTFTLNKGRVRLNLPQFTGIDELFYIAENPRGKIIPVTVRWDSLELPRFKPFRGGDEINVEDPYGSFVEKTRIIQKSYEAFSSEDAISVLKETSNDFDLVDADNVYRPETYIPFKTIAEMILEVIPSMYHRKNGKNEIVRITLPDPMTATADPIYFIDGHATASTEHFLSLNPSDLEYIAIVKDPRKLQPLKLLGKNGIVIVKSKPGKIAALKSGEQLQGLNQLATFSEGPTTIPDFKSTLNWIPSMSTDSSGRTTFEFFTSDDVGEMVVQVEGITTQGQPFLYRLPIEVR